MISIDIPSDPSRYVISFFSDIDQLKNDLLKQIGERKYILVTDENVFQKTRFFTDIDDSSVLVLPAGEEHKTWESVERILDHGFEHTCDRSSVFVAVGGGVIGDMVGFASSLFMRGVSFIQVPTTLLAMVDSSVGGKTGIDTSHGKNLIGSFHQPEAVLCGKEFLETLEFIEIQNGLSEMIKHGILGSVTHFTHLQNFAEQFAEQFSIKTQTKDMQESLFSMIPESIEIKKDIIQRDEKESGIRGFLNFGHTYGHAIELLSDFSIPHGIAVAKGMWCALQESQARGILKDDALIGMITSLFRNLQIDVSHPFDMKALHHAMLHDKKKKNGKIRLILPYELGKVDYEYLS